MVKELIKSILLKNKDYEEICCLQNIKKYFWHINWLKTIWFNIKVLPLNQAIKFPFIISYNCKINNIGKIILKNKIYPGMISIGVVKIDSCESNDDKIIFTNYGEIFFNGRAKFHPGAKICVNSNSILSFGARNSVGCNTKIISQCVITIGDDFSISWDGQIFDTDFHFLRNVLKSKIYKRKKPVIIGDNVFIGNSSTIGKGTKIPSGSVVSCCSKVSGDYSKEGDNLLIGGNPATILSKGFEMGNPWFPEKENEDSIFLDEISFVKDCQRMMNF